MKQALRNEITSLKKRHAEEDLHKYSSQIFERLIQTAFGEKCLLMILLKNSLTRKE